jgi:hypothetical protein
VQRHGIARQLQRASGSTPRDRVTIPQICSSCSLPLNWPRQSAPRLSAAVANHQTICAVRRHPPRMRQPLLRCTTRCIASIQIRQLARGTQIPIAPAARPYVPLRAVSSLGGFRTPAAESAAPSLKRPASETLHNSRHRRTTAACPGCATCRRLVGRLRPKAQGRLRHSSSPPGLSWRGEGILRSTATAEAALVKKN